MTTHIRISAHCAIDKKVEVVALNENGETEVKWLKNRDTFEVHLANGQSVTIREVTPPTKIAG